MDIFEFVNTYSERGDCVCGRCLDAPEAPQQPTGHTVDVSFFKVALKQPPVSVDLFRSALKAHEPAFASCDPFDGQPHDFIELGRWVGDQGTALQLMAMGALLGLWNLTANEGVFIKAKETHGEVP